MSLGKRYNIRAYNDENQGSFFKSFYWSSEKIIYTHGCVQEAIDLAIGECLLSDLDGYADIYVTQADLNWEFKQMVRRRKMKKSNNHGKFNLLARCRSWY